MTLPEDAVACARIVEQGDPDRFRTVMAAPVSTRAPLFVLYAFNVEVTRAPWVTSEAMIAEMRLQWWRDALGEIGQGGAVRAHEVTTPLAALLSPAQAARLDETVAARRWDIYRDPFEDAAHMDAYIDQTAGHLMWTACELLGAPPGAEGAVRALAHGAGVAAFLRAATLLSQAGRFPLIDGSHAAVSALARAARAGMVRPDLPKGARCATWPAMGARRTLDAVIKSPNSVADGTVPAGVTAWRLTRTALTGRLAL